MKKTKKTAKKEVNAMNIAIGLQSSEAKFVNEMDNYIKKLKKQQTSSKTIAYKEAMAALQRTGVVNKHGKPKKKIVTWE